MRGVKCHIYTCMGGEEVGGGGHGSRLALCCDRTVLPQKKSIGLSAPCARVCVCVWPSGSEL